MKNPEYIYVSGPMTGKEYLNFPVFNKAAHQLRRAGWKVKSPAELEGDSKTGMTWLACLRRDIIVIMQTCNKIALLPGWLRSRGARLEVLIGWLLGFEIHYVKYYVKQGRR